MRGITAKCFGKRRRADILWTPDNLFPASGAWFDSNDLSTLFQDSARTTPVTSDGDPVGAWDDKSGNGNHLTQATASERPVYRTSGGLSWVEFDQVDDNLTVTFGAPISQIVTSSIAFRTGTEPSATLGYLWDSVDGTNRHTLIRDSLSLNTIFNTGLRSEHPDMTNLTDFVVSTKADSTSSFVRINGSETSRSTGTNSMGGLTIGKRFNLIEPYLIRMYSGTWIGKTLTSIELALLESYNNRKAGL